MYNMYEWCQNQVGKNYNINEWTRFYLPKIMQPPPIPDTFTCSMFTKDMLNYLNPLDGYDRNIMTVVDIRKACEENHLFIASTIDAEMGKPIIRFRNGL